MKKNLFSWLKKESGWILVIVLVIFEAWLIKETFFLVEELKNTSLKLQNTIGFFENLAILQQEKKEAQKYFLKINQALPTEKDIFNLLNDLEKRSKEKNFEAQFQIQDIREEKKLKWAEFEFAFKGNFDQAIEFFKSLEKAPYFISFDFPKVSFLEDKGLYFFVGRGKIFLRNVEEGL